MDATADAKPEPTDAAASKVSEPQVAGSPPPTGLPASVAACSSGSHLDGKARMRSPHPPSQLLCCKAFFGKFTNSRLTQLHISRQPSVLR